MSFILPKIFCYFYTIRIKLLFGITGYSFSKCLCAQVNGRIDTGSGASLPPPVMFGEFTNLCAHQISNRIHKMLIQFTIIYFKA